jgi:hypothetical protein
VEIEHSWPGECRARPAWLPRFFFGLESAKFFTTDTQTVPGGDTAKAPLARRFVRGLSPHCALILGVQTEEKMMRILDANELKAVSGGTAPKRNPAKAPGESYQGPADKNFGPK